mmetsp:Transcript_127486/g.354918  ORF Transcript_127486/g.354918 Transcript_127486/m.354918 type:complete len:588 (+) Transcript_127486:3-1766(+)
MRNVPALDVPCEGGPIPACSNMMFWRHSTDLKWRGHALAGQFRPAMARRTLRLQHQGQATSMCCLTRSNPHTSLRRARRVRALAKAAKESVWWHEQVLQSFSAFEALWCGVTAGATEDFATVCAVVYKPMKAGMSQHEFQVRIPAGSNVAVLRSILYPVLVEHVSVMEPRPHGTVPLWDTEAVPRQVVLADFPGRPNAFYARLSVRECRAAHRMVKAFFVKPENQRKLDDIQWEAERDDVRYMVLMAGLLGREVYPSILRQFGMPGDLQPFQTMVHAFDSTYGDMEACRLWFESELLMRNRRKLSQAYAYLAYHCAKLGVPVPAPAIGTEAEVEAEAVAAAIVPPLRQFEGRGNDRRSPLEDGLGYLRIPLGTRVGAVVRVEIPWACRLAKRLPLVVAVVEGVYASWEADSLRELVEARGYWKYANGKGRTGLISELHIPGLARDLWLRMASALPLDHGDKWVVGLSEHLRFLKYGPDHFFAPHEDGSQNCTMENGVWTRSIYSALLYLSEPEDGAVPGAGGTRFIAPECPACASSGRCEDACEHCVDAPVSKGSVLLFAQSLLHAGTMPRTSEKFVMRTDVMFATR